jgi:hypothetical protein
LTQEQHERFVESIKAFAKLTKFQTGVISLLANFVVNKKELAELKKIFEKLDKD